MAELIDLKRIRRLVKCMGIININKLVKHIIMDWSVYY